MVANGCQPNVNTYNTVVNGMCKIGKTKVAVGLLRRMEKVGCHPDVPTYSTVIDGLCKDGQVAEALHLFSEMTNKGISPTAVTYDSLIHGLCNSGQWNQASTLLSEMLALSIGPTVFTVGILVDALCKEGLAPEAHALLKTIPDVCSYNMLINGFCKIGKAGRHGAAEQLFKDMTANGPTPNLVTYATMLDGLCMQGRVDEALTLFQTMKKHSLFDEMVANDCQPDVMTYITIVHGLCKIGKTNVTVGLLRRVEEAGCHPDVLAYSTQMDKAREAFDVMMIGKGCRPDIRSFNILINGYCNIQKMSDKGFVPNTVTCNTLLSGFSQEGRHSAAKQLLKYMNANGPSPDIETYANMLDCLCKTEALALFQTMEKH
ncbi:hypothetical protein Tsubulata_006760, partial [Turnera subulata]